MQITKRHIKRPVVKHIFKDVENPVMPVVEIDENIEEPIDVGEETVIAEEIIPEEVIEDVKEEVISEVEEEVIEEEKPKKRTRKAKNVEENNIVE